VTRDHEAENSPTLLARAVESNVALCEAVLAHHGVAGTRSPWSWSTRDAVPPYYPSLVTCAPGRPTALLDEIASLPDASPRSVKDSFACLDLSWRPLFDAHWYGAEAGHRGAPETGARFRRVEDADALAAWEADWQRTSPAPGWRIFPDTILEDERLELYRVDERGGLALNHAPDTIGVSNLFPSDPALHRDAVRQAASLYPDRAIVGYGAHTDLLPIGIGALGPLRVWIDG
jgi:hypothetical protein